MIALDLTLISICLMVLISIFLLFHDWVTIPPLTDVKILDSTHSTKFKLFATAISSIPVLIHLAIVAYHYPTGTPLSLGNQWYIVIYSILMIAGMTHDWYLPYFFGWPARAVKQISVYQKTWIFLPKIGNNPRPNGIHVLFHLSFLINTMINFYIIFGRLNLLGHL